MAPKFGTSGLRGLVTELEDPLCAGYMSAFLHRTTTDGTVLIGRDLRSSSPRIAGAVAAAVRHHGFEPLDCGVLPTPALALLASERGTAAVMVTGSHIPDDRNGLKFYHASGEITKSDEAEISAGYAPLELPPARPLVFKDATAPYQTRITRFFGPDALTGMTIGVYEHSSAARDLIGEILSSLGAKTVSLGRSDQFVPVDTEALDTETREMLSDWAEAYSLDAVISTDGDADRPMMADAQGRVVPGDRLGPLVALALGADTVVTPVTSNTCVDLMDAFKVLRTRIGSPYVLAGMKEAGGRVCGYEANGGFLLGFTAVGDRAPLTPLMTRDCVLPIVAPLVLARRSGFGLSELVATLPPRFTAADRLIGIETPAALALVDALQRDRTLRVRLLGSDTPAQVDLTDGFRATMGDGSILQFRPSGNAPEFRVYAEADTEANAQTLLRSAIENVAQELRI